MDAPEQTPPPSEAAVLPLESQDQQREEQDVNRLQTLPPLEYDRMNRDQRLAFIQWYQQTPVCMQIIKRYTKDFLQDIFDAYPTEEPADSRLKESLVGNFKSYLQQTWSSEGKQPPQPASYFLLHMRFPRLIGQGIYLPTQKDMVPALLFSLQEADQFKTQGLESIITAVGSKELHFHEVGTVYPNDKETMFIHLKQNGNYFLRANTEFMKHENTEVWFRRGKEGIPHFIFCPEDSAGIPTLPLPLSTPGEPQVILELCRLETMPALHLEKFRPEHKNDFYQWLLKKDKFKIRDDDPESLKLASHLFQLCSNGFQIANPKIPRDELVLLYEEYVQERWSMPLKQLPEPQSIYLFDKNFEPGFWIWLPPELMQVVESLVLSAEECNELESSKVLSVMLSITTSTIIKFEKQALLEKEETNCKITCFDGQYADIFRDLLSVEYFEVWFLRTQNKPKFIIKPIENRKSTSPQLHPQPCHEVKMRGVEGQLMKDETGSLLS